MNFEKKSYLVLTAICCFVMYSIFTIQLRISINTSHSQQNIEIYGQQIAPVPAIPAVAQFPLPDAGKLSLQAHAAQNNNSIITMSLPSNTSENTAKSTANVTSSSPKRTNQTRFYMPPADGVVKIILHGKYRSGSTFVSEFFHRHSDILYHFEPLRRNDYLFSYAPKSATVKILHEFFNCNFDSVFLYNGPQARWLRKNVFCEIPWQVPGCRKAGDFVTEEQVYMNCHTTPIHVIKVIRVPAIEHLMTLVSEGVKVVMLIRDVRGIMSSRNKVHTKMKHKTIKTEAKDVCDKYVNDVMFLRNLYRQNPDILHKSVHVVRYEDMARSATSSMKNLYEFIGVKPDAKLKKWAADNDRRTRNNAEQVETKKSALFKFGTRRSNPGFTTEAWRTYYDINKVLDIQEVCQDFMSMFGYRSVKNLEELRDVNSTVIQSFDWVKLLNQ